MTYAELNITDTTSGIDDIFLFASTTVPILIPLLLFAVFMVFLLISFYSSRKYGQGDFISSGTVASVVTSVIALAMTLKEGLINTYTLIVCFSITIVFVLLLIFTKNRQY